jgi:hypothetical protein
VFEYDGGTKVSFKNQQELLQFVQGTHPLLKSYPDMKARRVKEWKAWATDDGGRGFHRHELPIIADAFKAYWDTDVTDLDGVKQEIVSLLEVSGLIPPLDNRSIIRRLSSRTRDVSVLVAEESKPDRRVRQRLDELHRQESNEIEGNSVDEILPEPERSYTACIDLNDLRIEWMEHESYSYVGSLEILATEAYNGNTSIDDINEKISALNGMPFSEKLFDDIRELPRHRLRRKLQNFVKLRREINSAMPNGLFNIPHKRLLLEWISDGKRYTDGERMPRKTHCISKHNGQKQLTDESAYIIIFEALSSAFEHSASNSRIVELLHSFVRASYDPNMPLYCLDSKLNMLMGDEFLQRDERRDVFRKNRDKTIAYRPPKHLYRKRTQQMQGQQLLRNAAKYSPAMIESLPPEIEEQIKIGTINKEGHTFMEQKYQDELKLRWEARRTKKRAHHSFKPIDSDKLDQEAFTSRSAHDQAWDKGGDIKYATVVEKIATKSHFKTVKINEGFHEEILQVLPFIGQLLTPKIVADDEATKTAVKKLNKTVLMSKEGLVGQYLDMVKRIAKGKEVNTFDGVDLTDKTEDEILQEFVRGDR